MVAPPFFRINEMNMIVPYKLAPSQHPLFIFTLCHRLTSSSVFSKLQDCLVQQVEAFSVGRYIRHRFDGHIIAIPLTLKRLNVRMQPFVRE